MMVTSEEKADLAVSMGLSLESTVALPATITMIARKTGLSEKEVVEQLNTNEKLRKYVADTLNELEVQW